MKLQIIIADDHKIIQDGMASIIARQDGWEVNGFANDGQMVLRLMKTKPADIILMDINMPNLDGIETTRLLREQYPGTGVIILSMHNEAVYIKRALEAGAHGYLLKTAGKNQVIDAIKAVSKGGNFFPAEVKDALFMNFQTSQKTVASLEDLTQRETDVLRLIALEYSTKEIADKLSISTHTVDTHRKNLLSKLNAKNAVGLAKFALQNGLVE